MPRRVKFVKLPVIKPPRLPEGVPHPSELEKLPFEIVIMIMLSLDVMAILSLCSTSSIIRNICKQEWFWKQKARQDLGLSDDFEIGPNDTWKNFYLNKINPIRELKQFIVNGDVESFRTLMYELMPKELAVGVLWGRYEVPEEVHRLTLILARNIHKLMNLALKDKQLAIARIILDKIVEIEESFAAPVNKGLKTLCLMAQTPKAMNIFKVYLNHYIQQNEQTWVRVAGRGVWDEGSRVPWDDLMKCVIESGKKTLVGVVYTKFLNRYGRSRDASRVDVYVDYAESLGKKSIARHIKNIYNSYVPSALRYEVSSLASDIRESTDY